MDSSKHLTVQGWPSKVSQRSLGTPLMKYGEYFIQLLASSASLTFYRIGKQLFSRIKEKKATPLIKQRQDKGKFHSNRLNNPCQSHFLREDRPLPVAEANNSIDSAITGPYHDPPAIPRNSLDHYQALMFLELLSQTTTALPIARARDNLWGRPQCGSSTSPTRRLRWFVCRLSVVVSPLGFLIRFFGTRKPHNW